MTATGSAELRARASRARCPGVRTCPGFRRTPVAPAPHVVVDRDPRVPLADDVVGAVVAHPSRAVVRHRETPGDIQIQERPRRERPRQVHPHGGAVDDGLEVAETETYALEPEPS